MTLNVVKPATLDAALYVASLAGCVITANQRFSIKTEGERESEQEPREWYNTSRSSSRRDHLAKCIIWKPYYNLYNLYNIYRCTCTHCIQDIYYII